MISAKILPVIKLSISATDSLRDLIIVLIASKSATSALPVTRLVILVILVFNSSITRVLLIKSAISALVAYTLFKVSRAESSSSTTILLASSENCSLVLAISMSSFLSNSLYFPINLPSHLATSPSKSFQAFKSLADSTKFSFTIVLATSSVKLGNDTMDLSAPTFTTIQVILSATAKACLFNVKSTIPLSASMTSPFSITNVRSAFSIYIVKILLFRSMGISPPPLVK